MIYLSQLIYFKEGQEDLFHQFEDIAIPTIAKYNGNLLLRIRPDSTNFIENIIEQQYEVHLVSFEAQEDFENFKLDENRKKFLHLKEQSRKRSLFKELNYKLSAIHFPDVHGTLSFIKP